MIFQRALFFVMKLASALGGGLIGVGGAAYFGTAWFGAHPASWQLLICLALMAVGILIGGAGAFFLVVLPMSFRFPAADKPFSWERRDPALVYRLYRWYGACLQVYAERHGRRDA